MRCYGTFFLLLTTLSILPSGKIMGITFQHISLEQGLSQSSVYAICQDHEGFLWFGTQDGLDKYDGYSFRVFRNDPADTTSLSYNYILRLMVDRDGDVWIGTRGGGVSVYHQRAGRFTQYLEKAGSLGSLTNNYVHALYQDPEGVVWVGTENGLNRFDPRTGTFRHYFVRGTDMDKARDNFISAILQDREDRFWVCSINGASLLDKRTGKFTELMPRGIVVNNILQSPAGQLLFVGTNVWTYDSVQNKLVLWKKKLTDEIEPNIGSDAALLNDDGTIWIGSYNGLGLIGIDTDTLSAFRHNPNDPGSLSENSVLSLCKDKSGILWIGTYQGINKYIPTRKKFDYFTFNPKDPGSLSNIRVRGFAEQPGGKIWVATQDGLDRFNPSTRRFVRYFTSAGSSVAGTGTTFWSVMVDRTKTGYSIWGGTNGQGIVVLNFHRGSMIPRVTNIRLTMPQFRQTFSDVITALYHDKDGGVWAGSSNGVTRLVRSGSGYRQIRYPFPSSINTIFQDSSGNIWIGGYSFPLHRYQSSTDSFVMAVHDSTFNKTLAGKSVLSILPGPDSSLWVGTYGGLVQVSPGGNLMKELTVRDGLPNDVIYGILRDRQGNLWLSTDMGLCRYSPSTGMIKDYTEDDGLQSNEFNQGSAFEATDGKFYFGGINGFNSFYPARIVDNPNIPNVVFTDFKIYDKSVIPSGVHGRLPTTIWTSKRVNLNYGDAVLTFDFAALEYTDPPRNMYEYRLVGFDRRWVSLHGKREVTFTNLDPGKYFLRVKASNNDGVWNTQGASLEIYIRPPLWMTWWFRALVIVLILSIGPVVYYRRVRTLKKEAGLQRRFARLLIEREESERGRIAAELHDTIGQDLLVIMNRAYLAGQQKRLPASVRAQLDSISETVSQSLRNVREIVRNLRPYHLERIGLTNSLKAMLNTVQDSTSIGFEVSIDNVDGLLSGNQKERETNFFRIVQESVNNLVKHSRATAAWVIVKNEGKSISAVIRDNGTGFDQSAVKDRAVDAGMGLTGMMERAGMIGGTLTITSQPAAGTTVTITLPLEPVVRTEDERS